MILLGLIDRHDLTSPLLLNKTIPLSMTSKCEKVCQEDLPRLETSEEEILRQELLKLVKEQKPSISGLPINIKEFMVGYSRGGHRSIASLVTIIWVWKTRIAGDAF